MPEQTDSLHVRSTMHKWTVSGVSPDNLRQGQIDGYIKEPEPYSLDSWNYDNAQEYARHLLKSGWEAVVIKHIITEFVILK